MTEPGVSPRSTDPLLDTFGRRHAQDEKPKYDLGEAFTAACAALRDDTVLLSAFVEQLTAVTCHEKSMDAGHKAVVDAWKERAG